VSAWDDRAARALWLADRYPAGGEILAFYARLAEWQGAARGGAEECFPSLLELVRRIGPPLLREAAQGLEALPDLESPAPLDFFARAARQPFAATTGCGWCARPPLTGCLVPQGEGQAVELVCALCFGRRPFFRLRCPACGQAKEGRLVSYAAPEFPHLQVQACEDCRAYLLLVDRARDPEAIPEVDELAGLPLDLWAQQQGYRKMQRNLAGV